jgi:putative flippase GtrA
MMTYKDTSARAVLAQVYGLARLTLGRSPHPNAYVQLMRSLAVSVIALAFDFGLLVALTELAGINYLYSAFLSFIAGVLVNYGLSVLWVFPDRKLQSRRLELIVFITICAIGLLGNLLIIAVLVEQAGVDYRLAKMVSTVVIFFWNFLARKKLLY